MNSFKTNKAQKIGSNQFHNFFFYLINYWTKIMLDFQTSIWDPRIYERILEREKNKTYLCVLLTFANSYVERIRQNLNCFVIYIFLALWLLSKTAVANRIRRMEQSFRALYNKNKSREKERERGLYLIIPIRENMLFLTNYTIIFEYVWSIYGP